MCSPGISSAKTDEQIASDLRRHMSAVNSCCAELRRRQICVWFRSEADTLTTPPKTVKIEKKVEL